MQRDGRLLVSEGTDVARVRGIGTSAYSTGRDGARIDVTPGPYSEERPWSNRFSLLKQFG